MYFTRYSGVRTLQVRNSNEWYFDLKGTFKNPLKKATTNKTIICWYQEILFYKTQPNHQFIIPHQPICPKSTPKHGVCEKLPRICRSFGSTIIPCNWFCARGTIPVQIWVWCKVQNTSNKYERREFLRKTRVPKDPNKNRNPIRKKRKCWHSITIISDIEKVTQNQGV